MSDINLHDWNHEVWVVCKTCGGEYDLRERDICPDCGGLNYEFE